MGIHGIPSFPVYINNLTVGYNGKTWGFHVSQKGSEISDENPIELQWDSTCEL